MRDKIEHALNSSGKSMGELLQMPEKNLIRRIVLGRRPADYNLHFRIPGKDRFQDRSIFSFHLCSKKRCPLLLGQSADERHQHGVRILLQPVSSLHDELGCFFIARQALEQTHLCEFFVTQRREIQRFARIFPELPADQPERSEIDAVADPIYQIALLPDQPVQPLAAFLRHQLFCIRPAHCQQRFFDVEYGSSRKVEIVPVRRIAKTKEMLRAQREQRPEIFTELIHIEEALIGPAAIVQDMHRVHRLQPTRSQISLVGA